MTGPVTTSPTVDAVVYDFGGVFMASPFEAIRTAGAGKGIAYDEALTIVFGEYAQDTDHPWHRIERGEITLEDARLQIEALGREAGHEIEFFEMLRAIGSDGQPRVAMIECVRRVRAAGLRTGLLTNNIAEGREFWRPMLPLDELFDVVVDSSEVGMRKPNPAIYLHTLALLGDLDPARVAFLDDFAGNVAAADALGMVGILVEADPTSAIAAVDALLDARSVNDQRGIGG
jgi:epoxide hydrolase-like predicted phosphatase